MFRFAALCVSICLFLWLLPLGVFIDASKEKLLCNGKRAVCECSHEIARGQNSFSVEEVIASGGMNENERSLSAGEHDFLLSKLNADLSQKSSYYPPSILMAFTPIFYKIIDHPPQA